MQTSGGQRREIAKLCPRHCEPTGRANARPMTGSAKQSMSRYKERMAVLTGIDGYRFVPPILQGLLDIDCCRDSGLTAALHAVSFHRVISQNPRHLRQVSVAAELIAEPSGMTVLHQLQKTTYILRSFPAGFQEEKHGIGELVAKFRILLHLVEYRTRLLKYFGKGIETFGKANECCGPVRSQQRNQRPLQRSPSGAPDDQVCQSIVRIGGVEQGLTQARKVELDIRPGQYLQRLGRSWRRQISMLGREDGTIGRTERLIENPFRIVRRPVIAAPGEPPPQAATGIAPGA